MGNRFIWRATGYVGNNAWWWSPVQTDRESSATATVTTPNDGTTLNYQLPAQTDIDDVVSLNGLKRTLQPTLRYDPASSTGTYTMTPGWNIIRAPATLSTGQIDTDADYQPFHYRTDIVFYNPVISIKSGSSTIPLATQTAADPATLEVPVGAALDIVITQDIVHYQAPTVELFEPAIPDSTSSTTSLTVNTISSGAQLRIVIFDQNGKEVVLFSQKFKIISIIHSPVIVQTNSPVGTNIIENRSFYEVTFQYEATASSYVNIKYLGTPSSVVNGNTNINTAYLMTTTPFLAVKGQNTFASQIPHDLLPQSAAQILIELIDNTSIYAKSDIFELRVYRWEAYTIDEDCNDPAECGDWTITPKRWQCRRDPDIDNTIPAVEDSKCTGLTKPNGPITCRNSNRCQNGGTCNPLGSYRESECECPFAFIGDQCQHNQSSPCGQCSMTNGTGCNAQQTGCICNDGWAGQFCLNRTCELCVAANTASCGPITTTDPYGKCICKTGYDGARCQIRTDAPLDPCDECDPTNTASCEAGTCICNPGFTGSKCLDIVTNPCNQCNPTNTASCTDGICTCKSGFEQPTCNTQTPPCSTCHPENTASCDTTTKPEGVCVCEDGWIGTTCTIEADGPCADCNLAGTVDCDTTTNPAAPICICSDQWKGDRCHVEITDIVEPLGVGGLELMTTLFATIFTLAIVM